MEKRKQGHIKRGAPAVSQETIKTRGKLLQIRCDISDQPDTALLPLGQGSQRNYNQKARKITHINKSEHESEKNNCAQRVRIIFSTPQI